MWISQMQTELAKPKFAEFRACCLLDLLEKTESRCSKLNMTYAKIKAPRTNAPFKVGFACSDFLYFAN